MAAIYAKMGAEVWEMKATVMRKTLPSDAAQSEDDLLPEYEFDYSNAQPNRFAPPRTPGSRVVVLEPDVAEVFTTPESVNTVLRALIATMPKPTSDAKQ